MENTIWACCFFAWIFMLAYMFLIILIDRFAINDFRRGLCVVVFFSCLMIFIGLAIGANENEKLQEQTLGQEAIELSIELTRLKKLEVEL